MVTLCLIAFRNFAMWIKEGFASLPQCVSHQIRKLRLMNLFDIKIRLRANAVVRRIARSHDLALNELLNSFIQWKTAKTVAEKTLFREMNLQENEVELLVALFDLHARHAG